MRVLLVADMHVGSHYALADPDETPRYSPGKSIQRALYGKWTEGTRGPWAKPDAMVINGDAIDGQGTKDGGVNQWSTSVEEQVAHCAELIAMWRARRVYIIGGSRYHVAVGNTGMSGEEMLGQQLGAEIYPGQDHIPIARRKRSGPHWFLTFGGVTAHMAHHVSVSRVFAYMSTPIAREMMSARLNDPMRREWSRLYSENECQDWNQMRRDMGAFKTSLVVRAHAHYWWCCDTGGSTGMILPSWKAQDPFLATVNPLGFSHIGYVGVEAKRGDFRWEKHIFRIEDVQPVPHSRVGK